MYIYVFIYMCVWGGLLGCAYCEMQITSEILQMLQTHAQVLWGGYD